MTSKTKLMIAGAAMSGLLAGAAARASAATAAPAAPQSGQSQVVRKAAADKAGVQANRLADDDKGKHDCKGKNSCKGEGGCKSGDNGCKGKNSCKGKGGCNTKEEHKDKEKML